MKQRDPDSRSPGLSENAIRILHLLQVRETVARIDIADACGLSPTTVTAVTAELLQQGYIVELEANEDGLERGRGRPRVLLGIRPEALKFAGIKFASGEITASVIDFAGNRIEEAIFSIDERRYQTHEVAKLLKKSLDDLLNQSNLSIGEIAGLGVGIPGYVNHRTGVVSWSPVLAEEETDLRQLLESEIDCPVCVDNSANAVTLAERWFGLGAGEDNFIVITTEHGVGMGAVVNGELVRGLNGHAGEFGHTKIVPNGAMCRCGSRGCLEAYVGELAIVKEARTIRPENFTSTGTPVVKLIEVIADQARAGDTAYRQLFENAGTMLGIGIANLVNVYAPSRIILSGSGIRYLDLYREAVQSAIEDNVIRPQRGRNQLHVNIWGDQLWAQGAATQALQSWFERQSYTD